jgi:hypothetical protein
VVHVSRTGAFTISVPVGQSAHLAVGRTTAGGAILEDSTIKWPSAWTLVQAGAPVNLGVVRALNGSTSTAPATQRSGGHHDDRDDDDGENEGGGDDESCRTSAPRQAKSDLPCDAKIPLGASYKLSDSFLEKGPVPSAILSVTMEGGGTWHLAELQADTSFVVTQADCSHVGNRDAGRDRIVVTWRNADGSTDSDHLDLRSCDGDRAPSANAVTPAMTSGGVTTRSCDSVEICGDLERDDDSECDSSGNEGLSPGPAGQEATPCDVNMTPVPAGAGTPGTDTGIDETGNGGNTGTTGTTGTGTTSGTGIAGAACTTAGDCVAGLGCFQSVCAVPAIN